jgi:hypothetical protein
MWWVWSELNCSSVSQMTDLVAKDALLIRLFQPWKLAQYTMSWLFSIPYA